MKKTILIIEDDVAQQDIFGIALKKAGFNVVVRSDGVSGLRWLEQIMPDLIVLDIMLPGLSGVEILEAIRETANGQEVPIIIATASTLSEDDLLGYHISSFMRKPILPTVLAATVRELVPLDEE